MSFGLMAEERQYLLTEKTYKVLESAQKMMAEEHYADAENKLKALITKTKANSYDRAVVQQTLGYLYSSNDQYKKAAQQFQLALDSKALPEKVSHNLQYNLAQLLIAEDNYTAGIELLEQWFKREASPPNSARVLIATAYYRVKNYKKTVFYIKAAIANDKAPPESWYQVLLSAHLELKQYKSAIKVLETLTTQHPDKKAYWNQLGALYLQQSQEFRALAVNALLLRLELGDSKTVLNAAQMYRYLRIPYKSAQILSNAIDNKVIFANKDNLNRLADSWLAAKETKKAAGVLQQLAETTKSGEAYLKYGRVLFSLEQWQQSIKPLMLSSQKLEGKEVGKALLLLGMTYYHLDDFKQAKMFFTKASKYKAQKNQAGQWLNYIETTFETKAAINGS